MYYRDSINIVVIRGLVFYFDNTPKVSSQLLVQRRRCSGLGLRIEGKVVTCIGTSAVDTLLETLRIFQLLSSLTSWLLEVQDLRIVLVDCFTDFIVKVVEGK